MMGLVAIVWSYMRCLASAWSQCRYDYTMYNFMMCNMPYELVNYMTVCRSAGLGAVNVLGVATEFESTCL